MLRSVIYIIIPLFLFNYSWINTNIGGTYKPSVQIDVTKDIIKDTLLPGLSKEDIEFAGKSNIDTVILAHLRRYTKTKFEPLIHTKQYVENPTTDTLYSVLSFKINGLQQESMKIIDRLGEDFFSRDYLIFLNENDYSVCVTKCPDQYKLLDLFETNAYNYGLGPDKVIKQIKVLDARYNLDLLLLSVGFDVCSFKIRNENINWHNLAIDCYKFCPDIVTQGTMTVQELEKELKASGRLYFWWD